MHHHASSCIIMHHCVGDRDHVGYFLRSLCVAFCALGVGRNAAYDTFCSAPLDRATEYFAVFRLEFYQVLSFLFESELAWRNSHVFNFLPPFSLSRLEVLRTFARIALVRGAYAP